MYPKVLLLKRINKIKKFYVNIKTINYYRIIYILIIMARYYIVYWKELV